MEQEALQNVVPLPQMRSPHATRFVQVSKASLGQLRTQLLQILAPASAYAAAIGIYPLLFFFLARPLPRSAFRLRNIAPNAFPVQIHQDLAAVISLVGYGFFDA